MDVVGVLDRFPCVSYQYSTMTRLFLQDKTAPTLPFLFNIDLCLATEGLNLAGSWKPES